MASRLHQTTVVNNTVEDSLALKYGDSGVQKCTHVYVVKWCPTVKEYCREMLVFSSKWLEEF